MEFTLDGLVSSLHRCLITMNVFHLWSKGGQAIELSVSSIQTDPRGESWITDKEEVSNPRSTGQSQQRDEKGMTS